MSHISSIEGRDLDVLVPCTVLWRRVTTKELSDVSLQSTYSTKCFHYTLPTVPSIFYGDVTLSKLDKIAHPITIYAFIYTRRGSSWKQQGYCDRGEGGAGGARLAGAHVE